jgi:hypothetical protein
VDWLVSRQPAAKQAAKGPGSPYERLLSVCRLMALEPWAEMVGAPMGHEFLEVCERIDPESEALYREVVHECVTAILGRRSERHAHNARTHSEAQVAQIAGSIREFGFTNPVLLAADREIAARLRNRQDSRAAATRARSL